MKHLKILALGIGVSVLSALSWVGVAHSQRFTTVVEKDQIVNSSVYSAGKTINIKGTINGDVFCAGQNVNIDATIRGDVICAGSTVTIAGNIDGNIRVAGEDVSISADVSRGATVAASKFSLDSGAKIGQDLTAMSGTMNLKGDVGRDAVLNGGNVTVQGAISRNVKATVNTLTVDGGTISGNLDYTSTNDLVKKNNATITGTVTHHEPQHNKAPWALAFSLFSYLFTLFSVLIVGLLLSLMFPRQLKETGRLVFGSAGKSLLAGILGGLAIIVLGILLALTLVGLPLAGLLFALGLVVSILATPVAGYALGHLILRKRENQLGAVLLGIFILVTLYFVPFIGLLVMIAAHLLGTGAILRMVRLWALRAHRAKA